MIPGARAPGIDLRPAGSSRSVVLGAASAEPPQDGNSMNTMRTVLGRQARSTSGETSTFQAFEIGSAVTSRFLRASGCFTAYSRSPWSSSIGARTRNGPWGPSSNAPTTLPGRTETSEAVASGWLVDGSADGSAVAVGLGSATGVASSAVAVAETGGRPLSGASEEERVEHPAATTAASNAAATAEPLRILPTEPTGIPR